MRQKHNISEKAYAHFTAHIRRVFSLMGQGTSRTERAIRALDQYIEGSRHDFDNLRGIPEVQLALMMLQPEIDKCLARSAAARARANARREARKRQEETVTEPMREPTEPEDTRVEGYGRGVPRRLMHYANEHFPCRDALEEGH